MKKSKTLLIILLISTLAGSLNLFAGEHPSENLRPVFTKSQSENANDDKLLDAASRGNLQGVKDALNNGANINAQGGFDFTAILIAAHFGHLNVVEYMTEKHPSLVTGEAGNLTPLHTAAMSGELKIIKFLAKKYPSSLTAKTSLGHTAMHFAATGGHTDIVKLLSQENPSLLNEKTLDKEPPCTWQQNMGMSQQSRLSQR